MKLYGQKKSLLQHDFFISYTKLMDHSIKLFCAKTFLKEKILHLYKTICLEYNGRTFDLMKGELDMGQFKLPALPYGYDELEPYLDARTLEIHHGKHHAAYIANLNKALEDYSQFQHATIEELISHLNDLPEEIRAAVRNHGGGHFSHSLFWSVMSPMGGGEPSGDIAKAIEKQFGSFEQLKADLSAAAVSRFGSGWGWLVLHGEKLEVMSTPNQDTPYMDNKTPILVVDVWEHAYYLQYQNKRPDFVSAWWNVVNWQEVNRRYHEALS